MKENHYELKCCECGEKYSVNDTDYDAGRIECPECGKKYVEIVRHVCHHADGSEYEGAIFV